MHTLWLIVGSVLAFGLGIAANASASEVEDAISAAMNDANAGRCDQAFARLSERGGLENRARLLAGQCRIRAGLYPEALHDLDRIRAASDLTPSQIGDVELYRGIAFYHLERYTEASAALGRADGLTGEEAQLALYRGLIALRNGDSDRAAPALELAARLSPALTEPVASYYAGLAWQGSSERTKARAAFKRVVAIDGDGPWGKEAAKMLETTTLYPFYVNMSVGIEYDDNVLLRGGVTQDSVGVNTDGEKDFRGIWRIDAGVQLFEIEDWSGGITGGYSGTVHQDLNDFDVHYPTAGAYLARRFGPNTTALARYQYGFAWVDEHSFLETQVAELGVSHTWPKAGTTVVATDVIWNDLRFRLDDVRDAQAGGVPGDVCTTPGPGAGVSGCGPRGLREDHERDRGGVEFDAAVLHTYLIPISYRVEEIFEEIKLGGGYRFRYYEADGDEWDHFAHIVTAGIDVELPHDFRVSAHATYEYRDFTNSSTFPDREQVDVIYRLAGADREEHEATFEAEIEKDLTDRISVSARWSYVDNESNRRVYDYTRNIVGGYLNYRFD